jgi:hypothetical protein
MTSLAGRSAAIVSLLSRRWQSFVPVAYRRGGGGRSTGRAGDPGRPLPALPGRTSPCQTLFSRTAAAAMSAAAVCGVMCSGANSSFPSSNPTKRSDVSAPLLLLLPWMCSSRTRTALVFHGAGLSPHHSLGTPWPAATAPASASGRRGSGCVQFRPAWRRRYTPSRCIPQTSPPVPLAVKLS